MDSVDKLTQSITQSLCVFDHESGEFQKVQSSSKDFKDHEHHAKA